MRKLCAVLGDPQHAQPAVHITGTNGKGSVARMVTALLAQHDLQVGTFTSPHLESINERISRNGVSIGDEELAALLTDLASLEPMVDERLSYFELLTGAALRWFAEVAVDAAVVEVGLLGRWDATNVVDGTVAVLTNVGLDHTDGVGDWRRRVAEEKAGIVKPGATFVVGETDPELADTFATTPAAVTWRRDEEFACTSNRLAVGGRVLDLQTPSTSYDDLFLPLHGAHQGDNAAVALAAAEAFFGRPLDPDVVAAAFASVRSPGRFEIVGRDPLVILDGAHNPAGAAAVAATLDDGFTTLGLRHLVIGMLAGRDPHELVARLDVAGAEEVVCCTPDSPRALPAGELAAIVAELGGTPSVVPEVGGAVRAAVAA
ncbi:MAG TPA: Mur ligase family protein, partial [Acidimicrobiia bacterium]|nr:Mur ligase family protein [Acidimicrobiia bacterium]